MLMRALPLAALLALTALPAHAQVQETVQGWIKGDWALTLGASGSLAPRYEGASGSLAFFGQPIISLSKVGRIAPFVSRNDNISLALIDTDTFRMGPNAKLLFSRSDSDRDLRGLGTVPWGAELGVFADYYPTGWLRLRGELRHGIAAHGGVVGNLSADAFHDITPTLRISAGPRLSLGTSGYFKPYFGVNTLQSAASGLAVYKPGGGVKSVGLGGALTWKTTDKLTTSLFAEYSRLQGPAANSSLVRQRGSENQYLIGVSATYRFDFRL
jgi:outer membrane protein